MPDKADGSGEPDRSPSAILNRTIVASDLHRAPAADAAAELRRTVRWLALRRTRFAVNGVLRFRWRVRWHKMWEYARGLALADLRPGMRVLDFGGAATLPVLHLARIGCDVLSTDIDRPLAEHTDRVARERGWRLRSSTVDLTRSEPPADWGSFHRVLSFCVLEHLPTEAKHTALRRLAGLLDPEGILAVTFDFGRDAPVEGALRDPSEVAEMVAASGLRPLGNHEFLDTGERFVLDRKHPDRRFTFGSLFLRKTTA